MACVAYSFHKCQILDPSVEFFINAAERALARQRQIHSAEKIEFHLDNFEPPAAGYTANDFFNDIRRRVFDVVEQFDCLLRDVVFLFFGISPLVAVFQNFLFGQWKKFLSHGFVIRERA